MQDLFVETRTMPLAEALRPKSLSEFIGQTHLLASGQPLYLAFEAGKPHSMIFWGPPGVGKTTLARLASSIFDCRFIALSAVYSGVKDIRQAVEQAEINRQLNVQTILFIDEIHRFNKSQQDALLPYIESGLIILIGATTENPSFEINAALLSRTQVYVLKPLTNDELKVLFHRALQQEEAKTINFESDAIEAIIWMADGDGRRLVNLIEHCIHAAQHVGTFVVNTDFVQRALVMSVKRFDKGGDAFYDQISALHKSVRGSDPDAALYWLLSMLEAGVDPKYLIRRIIRIAWEDVGLADPRAMQMVNDAALSYERLGHTEGELALAQAVIYLSIAPKSNAGYVAYKQAKRFVAQDQSRAVPIHLRNAPTNLMQELGHGQHYRYPHDEPDGFVAGESYWPEGVNQQTWYQPVERGLEIKIAAKLAALRQLNVQKVNF